MSVLVTGATGFVGTALVESLVREGAHVRVLVPARESAAALAPLGVEVAGGDVRDWPAVRAALDGCATVYHLAGLVPRPGLQPADYESVHVQGTEHVMRAAAEVRVGRVVHCSSTGVYGLPRRTPADEEAPRIPVNVYQRSKLQGEDVVWRWVREHGLPAVIARPTALYGPCDERGAQLFRDVARGRVVMVGSGRVRCHLTYIDDAVRGLRACAARTDARGECFNIGSGEHPTVRELIDVIADAVGVVPRIVRLPAAPFALASRLYRRLRGPEVGRPTRVDRFDFFLAERTFDVSKARRMLGFAASVPLAEGVRRTIAWYRENGRL